MRFTTTIILNILFIAGISLETTARPPEPFIIEENLWGWKKPARFAATPTKWTPRGYYDPELDGTVDVVELHILFYFMINTAGAGWSYPSGFLEFVKMGLFAPFHGIYVRTRLVRTAPSADNKSRQPSTGSRPGMQETSTTSVYLVNWGLISLLASFQFPVIHFQPSIFRYPSSSHPFRLTPTRSVSASR
ncbi:hypothetical protein PCANC_12276 [Puccinia coronata f. sp. avenae]|uniref:Uncharacterized protein n=1 Tax=Puccinia coronata f. sp. avenae TaxID=200324 RepID=A0A2N5SZ30_9BASI|nr:hypothetical protein PCANC_12276 [Puccinia coronata f. sp. avenae]